MLNIVQNIEKIESQIKCLEQRYQLQQGQVLLMAVSKKKPVQLIEQAYHAGQRIFGESYVQEAIAKIEDLNHLKELQWHFIGPIQSNKTKQIAQHFNWVHSVDRLKIIQRLNDQRSHSQQPLNICLQVNIDNEAAKSGFIAEDILDAAKFVLSLPHLQLRGIMAIPKKSLDRDVQRQAFFRVKQLFMQLQELSTRVDTLSMGMSNDMEAAIAEGSTMVRIGTAIFGQRED